MWETVGSCGRGRCRTQQHQTWVLGGQPGWGGACDRDSGHLPALPWGGRGQRSPPCPSLGRMGTADASLPFHRGGQGQWMPPCPFIGNLSSPRGLPCPGVRVLLSAVLRDVDAAPGLSRWSTRSVLRLRGRNTEPAVDATHGEQDLLSAGLRELPCRGSLCAHRPLLGARGPKAGCRNLPSAPWTVRPTRK